MHHEFVQEISLTQMGIVNIENFSKNSKTIDREESKIIEMVSEENMTNSMMSTKKGIKFSEDKSTTRKMFQGTNNDLTDVNPILNLYQRVDQKELEKIGIVHKSELDTDHGGL